MFTPVQTPLDDYALIDFGNGRKLERFGQYLINRPAPQATGKPALSSWDPDWVYTGDRVAAGQWQARRNALPDAWKINVDGQRMFIQLSDGGQVGLYPEHIACWRWVRERLEGCYDIEDLKALNLFAATGGATLSAVNAGATVTHVDASRAAISQARENVGEEGARWIREDVNTYVERAIRRRETFDLIIADPPTFGRGPKGKSWDIQVDLTKLAHQLPHLISPACRGIWISFHTTEWSPQAVEEMLVENLPKRNIRHFELGVATEDGRVLQSGHAVCWEDDRDFLVASETDSPLTATEIEEQLDHHLDSVLSSRRTAAEPARRLSEFERGHQEFVIKWVEIVARSNNPELAYQLTSLAPEALPLMDEQAMEAWIVHAMDIYDRTGLHAAIAVLQDVKGFAQEIKDKSRGAVFEEVANVLELFVRGLSGRKLTVEESDDIYTDTEKLFLPSMLVRFSDQKTNFDLYKAIVTQLWTQCRFGTWRVNISEQLSGYSDKEKALDVLNALETIRLDACVERELPGMHRLMQSLRKQENTVLVPAGWEDVAKHLAAPTATVEDSIALLKDLYDTTPPTRICYQGRLFPEQVESAVSKRLHQEKAMLQRALARLSDNLKNSPIELAEHKDKPRKFSIKTGEENHSDLDFELLLDDQPIAPPDDVQSLVTSILIDLGEIPDDYLSPAGDGSYNLSDTDQDEEASRSVWDGAYHVKGAHIYNEWDYKRNHYRKQWCALRELDTPVSDVAFIGETLRKYSGVVKNLRRTFEALRGEDKLLKKQINGDDVDIDAFVEAYADVTTGMEMSGELFLKKHKVERNIAVMFMVDMSGSTKGWINDAERESLILLCEALETLGDRYAIYGFSGNTRNRCEVYRIKRFEEDYTDEVKGRICGIQPKDYTRMGVAIRHLTKLLNEVEARTKLLITLSDGKPDDLDGYRSEYGIEDTRMALIEAKQSGIHPFCITIDEEGNEYLPHMYGPVNYTVVNEVKKLPLKVSDIYRRLTT